jgi:hypothetical protein
MTNQPADTPALARENRTRPAAQTRREKSETDQGKIIFVILYPFSFSK